MSEELLIEKDGPVARVTINRPAHRNALNGEVVLGLSKAFDVLDADDAVRVIVLTGAGDKAFCAGADLGLNPSAGFLALHEGRGAYAALLQKVQKCGKPVVARVNGHALGGGLGLACACDIVVATDEATFGTPEIKLGLFPMMIMTLLVRHVPRKKLLEMMLTGQRLSGDEVVKLGLANYVVPPVGLDEKVGEIVDALASKSSAVLKLGKQAFYAMEDMPLEQALNYLHSMITINSMAEDAMEGVIAFMEKRDPEWKDR
ncbi:MAG: enoyl-CoA hydratase/isomerase family protein [Deltaproteobacteria bacterium]|nr:enoyl-CoA hydratase/isomerase family protein [Deltaproteobacteria bacterium]MCB9490022.1 enoyl-CoA hydratase/isomerase family protein [Deltaproteobacteria bacterium]